jgi:hypothetical protein
VFELIEQVSEFDRYATLAEILAHTRALAGKPEFRVETIATSRMGRDIELVSFGNGGRPTVLLWGFEDPHEPTCSLTIAWLWEQLADANSPIHDIGHNWAFVPCLNPDGVSRNEQWFRQPGDLRAFLNWSWEDEVAFWGAPQHAEEFALEEAIVRTTPELLYGMHDESHFPGHGYWALVSDEEVQESLGAHFDYESRIGVVPVPAPVKPEAMRRNWYFGRAHGLTGRCLSMICEPRGYRRLAAPHEPAASTRIRYREALSEYENALGKVDASSEEDRALLRCATSCLERMRQERLFAICVGACGLRIMRQYGKEAQAEAIEKAFWGYLSARLDGTYTTIPIRDQVRIQLHFLFTVVELAKGRKTFNSKKTAKE